MNYPMEFFTDEEKAKNPRPASLYKSPEERLYIILSILIGDNQNTGFFDVCIGRTGCYKQIKNLLDSYEDYDIERSIILVESREVCLKTNKEDFFLSHPNNSASVYSFCKQFEEYFQNRDDVEFIEIEDYRRSVANLEDNEEVKTITLPNGLKQSVMPHGVNSEAYDIFMEAQKSLE